MVDNAAPTDQPQLDYGSSLPPTTPDVVQPAPTDATILSAINNPGAAPNNTPTSSQGQPYPFKGGAPLGSIRATPEQNTAENLNINETDKGLAAQQGDILQGEGNELAKKQLEDATEKQQQSQDYNAFIEQFMGKNNDNAQRATDAYNKYMAAAGNLKDPSKQFWADEGQGARIMSAFAGAASGLAGPQGVQNFLGYLDKSIQRNYDAHKENVKELYDGMVESGKINDSALSWAKFQNEAKQHSYDLASAHILPELQAIKDRSTGNLQRVAADQAITAIQRNGIERRTALSQQEAAAAAAKLAAQRARAKEVRDAFQKNLSEALTAGYGEDQARNQAARATQALGYNSSELAPVLAANGARTNPTTGELELPDMPKPAEGSTTEAALDEKGNLVLPTMDENGKLIKPEAKQHMYDEAHKRIVLVDGKPHLATNEKTAETYNQFQEIEPEAQRLTKVLNDAWQNGNKGAYDQARNALIEIAPRLYGYKRGPTTAQAGESGGENADKATVAGQIPQFPTFAFPTNRNVVGLTNSPAGQAEAKLKGWGDSLANISKDARATVLGTAGNAATTDMSGSAADIAAKKNWKVVK